MVTIWPSLKTSKIDYLKTALIGCPKKKWFHKSDEKIHKKIKMTLYRARNLVHEQQNLVHVQQYCGVSFYKKYFSYFGLYS